MTCLIYLLVFSFVIIIFTLCKHSSIALNRFPCINIMAQVMAISLLIHDVKCIDACLRYTGAKLFFFIVDFVTY